jgi:RNA polymerase sigma factor (sigma-70 family)
VKELRLVCRLSNNRLHRARVDLGLTVAELCKRVGISVNSYYQLAGLKIGARGTRGDVRDTARKLAEYLGMSVDELFPPSLALVRESTVEREIDSAEIHQLLSESSRRLALPPDADEVLDAADAEDARSRITDALSTLTEREEVVIRRRFGLDDDGVMPTLGQVGEEIGIRPQSVCLIEMRALRKLRHHSRTSILDGRRTIRDDERRSFYGPCPEPWKGHHATRAAWESGYVFAMESPPITAMPQPTNHPKVGFYCGGPYPGKSKSRQAFIDGWNLGRSAKAEEGVR